MPDNTHLQEFKECLSTEKDASKCTDLREDYMECLHHKKEVRVRQRLCRFLLPCSSCCDCCAQLPSAAAACLPPVCAGARRTPQPKRQASSPRPTSRVAHLRPCPLVPVVGQITRFNKLSEERERKIKAGEPVPQMVNEQVKAGAINLPWTTAS